MPDAMTRLDRLGKAGMTDERVHPTGRELAPMLVEAGMRSSAAGSCRSRW